jgi:type I restriction enzyme S subunit
MSEVKLPEGWIDVQLGQIIDYGKANKKVLSDVMPSTWVLELEDIEKDSSKLLNQVQMSERPFKSTKNSFKKGDVLYGKLRPYLNKVILANSDGVCTTEIIPISAEPLCSNKYIFYWLKNSIFLRYVNAVSYGVNMPRLGTSDGNRAPFRLAPFAEQKIIADKLDTLLAQVGSTKARLEQIPQILKRFRQTVLASAMSRRLIPKDQKSNVRFDVSVGSLCITSFDGPFGSKLKTDDYTNTGVRVARLENIGHLTFNDEKETYISDTKFNSLKGNKIEKDDVLFSSFVDEDVRVCLFPHNDKTFINKADCFCLRINQEIASPKYVALTLASRTSYEQIKAQVQGVTRPRINLKTLRSLSFSFPSLQEQNEIVRRVEQLFAYADGIEKQVQNALECVNNLTQSILAKAFRGELTAQWRAENPDLISGENSAQALLAKIQQQRKSTKTIKRSKGNS